MTYFRVCTRSAAATSPPAPQQSWFWPPPRPCACLRPAHAQARHDRGDLGADVGHLVGRRQRQVGRVRAGPVTVAAAGAAMLAGAEAVEAAQRADLDLGLVEQAEGELGRDPHLVGIAAAAQEGLGAQGRRARVALVAEAGARLGRVADQDQGRLGGERVGEGGGEVGPQQRGRPR